MSISSTSEPQFFSQASGILEWDKAMVDELQALELNNKWSIVSLPARHHTVGCKWVYKVKFCADETVERHKA